MDDLVALTIPFQFDQLFTYVASVTLGACLGYSASGADGSLTGSAIGDFANTGLLQAAIVVDGLGNVIPGATIASLSGVDYQAAAVPIPALGLWLLPAWTVLARFGTRRGRKVAGPYPARASEA